MAFNPIDRYPNIGSKQAEYHSNDEALLRDAENKIRILEDFLITGDLVGDYNYFLEITSRNINYKKATNEPKEELIKNLEIICNSLLENESEKNNDTNLSEANKMFYEELPKTEIRLITKLIESYK